MNDKKLAVFNFHIWEFVYVFSAFGLGGAVVIRDYLMMFVMISFFIIASYITKYYHKKLFAKRFI